MKFSFYKKIPVKGCRSPGKRKFIKTMLERSSIPLLFVFCSSVCSICCSVFFKIKSSSSKHFSNFIQKLDIDNHVLYSC